MYMYIWHRSHLTLKIVDTSIMEQRVSFSFDQDSESQR